MNESNRIQGNGAAGVYQKHVRTSAVGTSQSFYEELLNLQFASSNLDESEETIEVSHVEASSSSSKNVDKDEEGISTDNPQSKEIDDVQAGLIVPQQLIPIQTPEGEQVDSQSISESDLTTETEELKTEELSNPLPSTRSPDTLDQVEATSSLETDLKKLSNTEDSQNLLKNPNAETKTEETSIEPTVPANQANEPVDHESLTPRNDSSSQKKRLNKKAEEAYADQSIDETNRLPTVASAIEPLKVHSTDIVKEESDKPVEISVPRTRRAERLERSRKEVSNESDSQNDESTLARELDSIASTQDQEPSQEVSSIDLSLDTIVATSASESPTPPITTEVATVETAQPSSQTSTVGGATTASSNAITSFDKTTQSITSTTTGISATRSNETMSDTKTRGSTTPGASPLSKFQESKLVQRVFRGFEQLGQGGGQVRLRLHPPELGTLQMTLRIEGNVVSAQLEVENSLAKDALLNNVQSLRDRLSEQGMSVDRFEVTVQTDSQSSSPNAFRDGESDRQSRWKEMESRYAALNENRQSQPTAEETRPTMPWFRTTGTLDLSV